MVIDRYREVTASLDSRGGSVLDSRGDGVAMPAGFLPAARLPVAASAAIVIGMRVVVSDPHAAVEESRIAHVPFAEALAAADIVVCLATSDASTRDLFDAAAFARMKRGARFINLARGEVVDEAALAAALDSGHLAGAAMDVGRAPDQRPSLALARRPEVVATPHVGGMTPEAMEHQAMDTVRQVAALARGEMPDNAVNAAAAHRLARIGVRLP